MTKHLAVAATLAILLSACSDVATAPSPAPPAPTYTLSGTVVEVTESGSTPVQGVQVDAGLPPRHALTNTSGFFSISGLSGRTVVVTSKFGYRTDTTSVSLTGDMRLDITVNRLPTYTLSGIAFELTPAGHVPIEGVEIYCDSCGPDGHTFAYTDSNGRYVMSEVLPIIHSLLVRKTGFAVVDPTGKIAGFDAKDVKVEGDTRFDIELVRR